MTETHPAVVHFIERIGRCAEAEGLPRIAGRLMGLLLVEGGPYTFDELAERLQVSRGSVSTNTRLLETLGILDRVTKPGDRHDYYQLALDPYGRLVEGQVNRMRRMATIIAEARRDIPSTNGKHHLKYMERFYTYAIKHNEDFLAGWRAEPGVDD